MKIVQNQHMVYDALLPPVILNEQLPYIDS